MTAAPAEAPQGLFAKILPRFPPEIGPGPQIPWKPSSPSRGFLGCQAGKNGVYWYCYSKEGEAVNILVLSDSHGHISPMEQAVLRTQPHLILHLGVCWRDGESLHRRFPHIPFDQVPGNCDFRPEAPAEKLLFHGDKRIIVCHGHTYGVKQSDRKSVV